MERPVEHLLRELAPQVLATLARQYGDLDSCEDATQEALLAALTQWPGEGVPSHPRGWLLTVARRSLVDHWRRESARRQREERAGDSQPLAFPVPGADEQPADADDTLTLLFLCCQPTLAPAAQIALTLRAVGGLTTKEIAGAFFVSEATMAKRISRAKQSIGHTFERPKDLAAGRGALLSVLYLIFNEGYTASSGPTLHRVDLSTEAIRITRLLRRLMPGDGEVAGLLALMLLTDARRPARTDSHGSLIPLEDQDRSLWDHVAIQEGITLLTETLGRFPVGQYQIQAAVAAVHDEAPTAADTDWPQILALYTTLEHVAPGPMVTLSRAVALANVHGPRAGLAFLETWNDEDKTNHRLDAVRAHLHELAGDTGRARDHYLRAARTTASLPEQRYLHLRASRLNPRSIPGSRS